MYKQISLLSVDSGPREVVIYDLAWSPDGQYLIAGSDMDNSARIWNLIKRKSLLNLIFVIYRNELIF